MYKVEVTKVENGDTLDFFYEVEDWAPTVYGLHLKTKIISERQDNKVYTKDIIIPWDMMLDSKITWFNPKEVENGGSTEPTP